MLQSAPYTSVLMFDPADDMDTGNYRCTITGMQNSYQPFIIGSSGPTVTTNLNITGQVCLFIYPIHQCIIASN